MFVILPDWDGFETLIRNPLARSKRVTARAFSPSAPWQLFPTGVRRVLHRPEMHRRWRLCDLLIERGWRLDDDLQYMEDEKASHTEESWGHRVDPALRFLFPAQYFQRRFRCGSANVARSRRCSSSASSNRGGRSYWSGLP
jgi:hypothetical protein